MASTDPARQINILLGRDVRLPMDSVIQCPRLEIGDCSRINGAINIRGSAPCFIGKYCALGYGIHILTTDHKTCHPNIQIGFQRKYGFKDLVRNKGPLHIGHNVWIGDKVTVLPGVSIGNGAVIGAGSIVTGNLEPFSINYGNPCRQHGFRFSQAVIEQLESIQWWHWDDATIRKNSLFFNLDLNCADKPLTSYIE